MEGTMSVVHSHRGGGYNVLTSLSTQTACTASAVSLRDTCTIRGTRRESSHHHVHAHRHRHRHTHRHTPHFTGSVSRTDDLARPHWPSESSERFSRTLNRAAG